MKKYFAFSVIVFSGLIAILISSCAPKCDPSSDVIIGNQTISFTYLDSITGQNYLDSAHWNVGAVKIFLDTTGGKTVDFQQLPIDYANKKFGPYTYTKNFINPTTQKPNMEKLIAKSYNYDYHIVKDVYGTDILRVTFELSADECNTFWRVLDFYIKKEGSKKFEKLTPYSGKEKVEIIITE